VEKRSAGNGLFVFHNFLQRVQGRPSIVRLPESPVCNCEMRKGGSLSRVDEERLLELVDCGLQLVFFQV
jgi:hypothetical protein